MSKFHVPLQDQFDIPKRIIPLGLSYLWCGKTVLGEPDPAYQAMLAAGWCPVPFQRHADFFTRRARNADGEIEVDGQILMSRLKETTQEAHDLNADKAHRQAGANHRLAQFEIPIMLNRAEMGAAEVLGISCQEFARRRVSSMLEGVNWRTILVAGGDEELGGTKSLRFASIRRPCHPYLRWLFDLISTEA